MRLGGQDKRDSFLGRGGTFQNKSKRKKGARAQLSLQPSSILGLMSRPLRAV